MSDKKPLVENPSRRSFLKTGGALSAQAVLPLPSVWAAGPCPAIKGYDAVAQWLECHQGLHEFVMQPFHFIGTYIIKHPDERALWTKEAKAMIAAFAEPTREAVVKNRSYLMHAGDALIKARPSYEDIVACLRSLKEKDELGAYDFFADGRTLEEAAAQLHSLSTMPHAALVRKTEEAMVGLQRASRELQIILDTYEPERNTVAALPVYSSMAAARKAGGYPVPNDAPAAVKGCANAGNHDVSGEWSMRVQRDQDISGSTLKPRLR